MRAGLAFAILFLSTPMLVMGHGYLSYPRSRNYIANSDYCPHCLNAGGAIGGRDRKLPPSLEALLVQKCDPSRPSPRPWPTSPGPKVVRVGSEKWPKGQHGICGDKYSDAQPRPHEAGGKHYSGEIGGGWHPRPGIHDRFLLQFKKNGLVLCNGD